MGTSWKEQEVSEAFNQYNDMLENILGYEVILDMVRNDKTITKILDFGCGPGKVCAKLASSNENYRLLQWISQRICCLLQKNIEVYQIFNIN